MEYIKHKSNFLIFNIIIFYLIKEKTQMVGTTYGIQIPKYIVTTFYNKV